MITLKHMPSLFCATLVALPTLTQAQSDSKNAQVTIPEPVATDTWEYSIAPYAWLSGMKGTAGVKGVEIDVDAPLDEILDVLDFAGYLAFNAQKGNWGYYADTQYIKLSGSQSGPQGPLIDKVKMGLEQFGLEAGVKYRVFHNDRTSIWLLAGASYTYFSTDLEIKGNTNGYIDGSTDWIDPTVGITLKHQFNDKWNAHVTGQAGGFGVSSDMTWQALAGVGYSINDCWNVIAGYRYESIDYQDGGFTYDLEIAGPVLGAVYRF